MSKAHKETKNENIENDIANVSDIITIAIGNGLFQTVRDKLRREISTIIELQTAAQKLRSELNLFLLQLDTFSETRIEYGDIPTLKAKIQNYILPWKETLKKYLETFDNFSSQLPSENIPTIIYNIKTIMDTITIIEISINANTDEIKNALLNLQIKIYIALNNLQDVISRNALTIENMSTPERSLEKNLENATTELNKDPPNNSKALDYINHTYNELFNVISYAPWQWKVTNRYGLDIWLYLVFFILSIFSFYYFDLDQYLIVKFGLNELAINTVTFGALGGIFRGIWWLMGNLNKLKHNKNHLNWYLSCPVGGGILGAFIYLFTLGGVLLFSQLSFANNTSITDQINDPNDLVSGINGLLIISLAILAGYKWEFIVKWIDDNLRVGKKENNEK